MIFMNYYYYIIIICMIIILNIIIYILNTNLLGYLLCLSVCLCCLTFDLFLYLVTMSSHCV
jgi:hypothetical protein